MKYDIDLSSRALPRAFTNPEVKQSVHTHIHMYILSVQLKPFLCTAPLSSTDTRHFGVITEGMHIYRTG